MAKKKKSKEFSSAFPYIAGTLALVLLVLWFALYSDRADYLKNFQNYLESKQLVHDMIGELQDIKILSEQVNPDASLSVEMSVQGSVGNGKVSARFFLDQGTWLWSDVIWNSSQSKSMRLSRFAVQEIAFHAGSLSSAPLKQADFFSGETIFFRFVLGFIPKDSKGVYMTESMEIRDANGAIIAQSENIASFKSEKSVSQINFQNQISALSPGRYTAEFVFSNHLAESEQENFLVPFAVKDSQEVIIVDSVRWYSDAAHREHNKDAQFLAGQNIYLEMVLQGFAPSNQKVAGTIELEIQDDRGQVIAQKNKFAAFQQEYKKNHSVVIPGELKITDPGLYFLKFIIKDHGSHRQITHQEKLVVLMKK